MMHQIDYSIKDLDGRMQLVNTILQERQESIEKYFGQRSINILLQQLANYILNCGHNQKHKEKMQKNFEKSALELTETQYILNRKVKIKKSDYKIEAIKEKRDLIVYVFNKYGGGFKAQKWIQDLKYDQVVIKQSERGFIKPEFTVPPPFSIQEFEIDNYWKNVFEITSINHLLNLDLFEIDSWKTILKLLPFYKKVGGNIDRLVKIFNKAYHLCDFTPLQKKIIREFRFGVGNKYNDFIIMRNIDVANKLKVQQDSVSDNIEYICQKLISAYETLFTEYYYIFLVRGKYKRCKMCGKTKIIQDFYENRAVCKACFGKN